MATKQVNIRMDTRTKEILDTLAERDSRSLSNLINLIIKLYIDKQEKGE